MAFESVNYQCPACGGPLHFASAEQKLVCDYCDSRFEVEEVEALYRERQDKADAKADAAAAAPKPAEGKKTKEQKRAEAQARAALNKKLKGVRNKLKKIEAELDKKRARYDELMELMASEELYADQDKFNAALGEYNGLKQELPKLEDEWLELSTQIEEETARELS